MDKYERRRRRVQELLKHSFENSQARLAEAIDRDPNYVSRMLYPEGKPGKKRIGEAMRDSIEQACHLTPGSLDMDPGSPFIPDGAVHEPAAAYEASGSTWSWPFEKLTPAEWTDLSLSERRTVESVALTILRRVQAARRPRVDH
jgi:hypothetical protein